MVLIFSLVPNLIPAIPAKKILFFLLHNVFQQEFSDPRDADDARYYLDGRDVDGRCIIVEFAKGVSILYMYFLEFPSCQFAIPD